MNINDTGQDNALAYGGSHTEVEHKYGNEIEECSENHRLSRFQYAGGDHGSDGICCVMKTIDEIKHQGQKHQ